jgi:hypothetical protein
MLPITSANVANDLQVHGGLMPRKASSVEELDQLTHVHHLLCNLGTMPSPLLEVTTASGKTITGQLLRDVVGNQQGPRGWSSYGSILLSTERGKMEIDYLDIVSVQKKGSPTEQSLPSQPAKKKGAGSSNPWASLGRGRAKL